MDVVNLAFPHTKKLFSKWAMWRPWSRWLLSCLLLIVLGYHWHLNYCCCTVFSQLRLLLKEINVLYKIISKVLANKIKLILPSYTSLSQNAFVPGRLIADSSLLANELLSFINHCKKGTPILQLSSWTWATHLISKLGFPHLNFKENGFLR